MTLDEAVLARLDADAAVTALAGTRIFWALRDQGSALPALVLTTVSQVHGELLDGPEDMVVSRLQADAYAETHADAWDLARAVQAALRDEAEVGDMKFWGATVEGPRDLGEDPDSGEFIHRASTDVILRHTGEG